MEINIGLKIFTYFAGLSTIFQVNVNGYLFGIILARKMKKVLIQFGKKSKVIRYWFYTICSERSKYVAHISQSTQSSRLLTLPLWHTSCYTNFIPTFLASFLLFNSHAKYQAWFLLPSLYSIRSISLTDPTYW